MSRVSIDNNDRDVRTGESPGDVAIVLDYEVEVIQELEQGPPGPQGPPSTVPGPPGPQGPQGFPGADGNTIIYGTVDPTPEIGSNGDSYINKTTNTLFGPKAAGVWPAGVSIVGPQGPVGPKGDKGDKGDQGIQGIQGVPGADGKTILYGSSDPLSGVGVNGDFYINTTTHFMFGPKAGGAWPAGTSLVGPQGPVGPAGPVPEAPTDGQTYARKNSAWTAITTASVIVSDTPPSGAAAGTLWWESDSGNLYILYDDGNTSQWVLTQPGSGVTSGVMSVGGLTGIVGLGMGLAAAGSDIKAALPYYQSILAADVALSSSGTHADGPFVAQGATGAFLVAAQVMLQDTAAAAPIGAEIHDGTNLYASTMFNTNGAGFRGPVSLVAIAVNPPGNLRVRAWNAGGQATSSIKANSTGWAKDTIITAVRIA